MQKENKRINIRKKNQNLLIDFSQVVLYVYNVDSLLNDKLFLSQNLLACLLSFCFFSCLSLFLGSTTALSPGLGADKTVKEYFTKKPTKQSNNSHILYSDSLSFVFFFLVFVCTLKIEAVPLSKMLN